VAIGLGGRSSQDELEQQRMSCGSHILQSGQHNFQQCSAGLPYLEVPVIRVDLLVAVTAARLFSHHYCEPGGMGFV
jgi:hypothetical protein